MKAPQTAQKQAAIIGRYVLYGEIASGGMATVHYGRLLGQVGFTRTVAIKRMHPHCAKDPEFASMFLDEARLVARIRHPNVVPILDVVAASGELSLVMEYVQGETLSRLLRGARKRKQRPPLRVVGAIMTGVLEGLHAAHEAVSERGDPLGIVHRDVSPQNIMVGIDGIPRVLDFGIAKASVRLQTTKDGQLKGKLQYMAPEQIRNRLVDRRTDVYAASVVLWEALVGRRLFEGDNEAATMCMVLEGHVPKPRDIEPGIPEELERVALQGLEVDPNDRYQTAQAMAIALEQAIGLATPREVGHWVEQVATDGLRSRAADVAEIESVSSSLDAFPPEVAEAAERSAMASAGDLELVSSPSMRKTTPMLDHGSDPAIVPFRTQWPRSVWIAIALLPLAVLLVVAAMFLWSSPSEGAPEVHGPVPGASSAAGNAVVPSEDASPDPSSTEGPTPQDASAMPSSSTTATLKHPPTKGTPPAARTVKPPATAPTPTVPKTNCNPPYTIDSEGFRVPKPQCL